MVPSRFLVRFRKLKKSHSRIILILLFIYIINIRVTSTYFSTLRNEQKLVIGIKRLVILKSVKSDKSRKILNITILFIYIAVRVLLLN